MRIYSLLLVIIVSTTTMFGQRVRSVLATVKDDRVLIGYEIKGLKCEQKIEEIDFYVSRDGGENYTGPLQNVSGDLEPGIRNGKHIVEWDALKEMPFNEEVLIFDVRVDIKEKKRKKAFMISVVSNATTPLGGRIGQLGKVSWYIEGRSSILAGQSIDYSYKHGVVNNNGDENNDYELTGKKGWKAYSAIVGATFQFSCNVFMYLGAGYGYEDYIREVDVYEKEYHQYEGTFWAKDEDYGQQGVEFDGGFIFKYKALIVSGGITTINFNKLNWTVGLGVAF